MSPTEDTKQPLAEQLSLIEKVVGAGAIGLVLSLSCAGYGVWWLAWCAMAPFLVLIRACKSWTEAVASGMSFGFAYNLLTLFWLFGWHLSSIPAKSAIVLAIFTALVDFAARAVPWALFSLLLYALPMRAGIFPDYRRPFFPYIVSVPVVWFFFEYLSGLTIGIRINDLSYSQAGQLAVIQIARLGSSMLLTFLLILCNTALAQLILSISNLAKPLGIRTDRLHPATGSLVDLMTVSLLVVLCVLIGRGNPESCLNKNVPTVAVSINRSVQGIVVNMQDCPVALGAEGVSRVLLVPNKLLYIRMRRSYLSKIFSLPAKLASFLHPATGKALTDYLVNSPKESTQVISSPWGRIGISTGVDQFKPALEKEEVRHGAGLLLSIIDSGYFHSTILNREIAATAAMAAVENGRFVVLLNNHGINAIINPCGEIVAMSLPQESKLSDQVQFLYRNPYFSNVDFK